MKRTDQISAVFWLLLAIFVCFKSLGYKLMEKAVHVPGPGFAPFLTAIVMVFLAIALLAKSSLGNNYKRGGNIFLSFKNFKEVILLSVLLLAYALLLNNLGYILSMSVLMTFLFRGQFKRGKVKKWLMPIAVGLLVTLATYFIFSYLLKCQIPKGLLGI